MLMSNEQRGFFGRRIGHPLRARQAELFSSLLPRLALDLSAPAPNDLASLFPTLVEGVRLEVGFGGAEHLIAQAQAHPRTGFIGCEPFVNGMAKGAVAIDELPPRQHSPASRRCSRAVRLVASAFAHARRSAVSRSVAEAAALEAPFRV